MLASITPLGERGRRSRWGVTVTAFVIGSTVAGAALGTLAGALGAAALGGAADERWRLFVLAGLVALGLLLDLRVGGLRVPTTRRQVNEDWLVRYRGWVYGAGFGAQLGAGVFTIVTTATVYLVPLAAFLLGSTALGLLVGATFGAVRGVSILPAARSRDTAGLMALHRRMRAWEPAGRRAVLVVQALLLAGALLAAIT
jgi:MFS family permease